MKNYIGVISAESIEIDLKKKNKMAKNILTSIVANNDCHNVETSNRKLIKSHQNRSEESLTSLNGKQKNNEQEDTNSGDKLRDNQQIIKEIKSDETDHHRTNGRVEGHQGAAEEQEQPQDEQQQLPTPFKAELVWTNIILFVILHSCLPIGAYMIYTQRPWKTFLFSLLCIYASGLGVTGGSHRLWSHRSYKAKWPVQVLLVILQTMAGQNSVYTWSRDHRVHHKYSETDADPHNIKRGFFFAHMGWLCCRKHPDVKEKGKLIDMSDLEANPYVMFQHKHFWWMAITFTVLAPTMIPVLLWGERFWTAFVLAFMVRYVITLHGTWLVNSAAHYYGERPYDTRIEARESPYVIYNALGEGFHNYHHTFPYDYATSEFGRFMNITTAFIDLCASFGLVHDRRKVDSESILKRRARTGDLTEEQLLSQQVLHSNGYNKHID